jgi:L-ribulokinase
LTTKPEELYRALVEATGFGTRLIMEAFESAGVRIEGIYACGGIAEKDPFLMQIYADITNREIRLPASGQTAALGAAMYASVAAGAERGGYDHITEAATAMSKLKEHRYQPDPKQVKGYSVLYRKFKELSDYFGRTNPVMKELKEMRAGHTP